jgi:MFS family permease
VTVSLTLVIVMAIQAVATMSILGLAVLAPPASVTLGVPATLVGIQVSIIYGAGMLTSGSGGALVRRFGPCRTSQMALLLVVVGTLLLATARLEAVFAGSILLGLAYGMTNPAASEILLRVVPPKRHNLMFSIKQTGVPLGGVLASLTLPFLAELVSWQVAIAAVGVTAAALAVLLGPFHGTWDAGRDPESPLRFAAFLTGPRLLLSDPQMLQLGMGCFFLSFVQLSLASFVVTLLVLDLEFSLAHAGALAAAMHVAGAVGRVAWGMLADWLRHGCAALVILAALLFVACLAVPFLDAETPRAVVQLTLVALGATALGWNGVYLAEVARRSPPGRVSDATGAILVAAFAGVVIGPSMMSATVALIGSHRSAFLLCAVAAGVALALLLRLVRR